MNSNSSMAGLASLVQSRGRNGDSMLVHMTPGEVSGLQSLALAHGGQLSINPDTGLYEANFLKKLLPTIIGAVLTPLTGGLINPLTAGFLVGGVEAARTGDLGKGLMAGLGAYGGAGLSTALAGTGAAAATGAGEVVKTAGAEAAAAAAKEGATQAAQKAASDAAMREAAQAQIKSKLTTGAGQGIFGRLPEGVASLKNMGAGTAEIFKTGGAGLGGIGGMGAAGSAFGTLGMPAKAGLTMTAANALSPDMEVPGGGYQIDDSYYEGNEYDPATGTFRGGQWRKGYPGFPPPGMAEGGVIPAPNGSYPLARPSNSVGGYGPDIDPYTGEEQFADGGSVGNNQSLEAYYQSLLAPPVQQGGGGQDFANYMQGLNKFVTSPVAAPTPPAQQPPPAGVAPPGAGGRPIAGGGGYYGDGGMRWDSTQGRFVADAPQGRPGGNDPFSAIGNIDLSNFGNIDFSALQRYMGGMSGARGGNTPGPKAPFDRGVDDQFIDYMGDDMGIGAGDMGGGMGGMGDTGGGMGAGAGGMPDLSGIDLSALQGMIGGGMGQGPATNPFAEGYTPSADTGMGDVAYAGGTPGFDMTGGMGGGMDEIAYAGGTPGFDMTGGGREYTPPPDFSSGPIMPMQPQMPEPAPQPAPQQPAFDMGGFDFSSLAGLGSLGGGMDFGGMGGMQQPAPQPAPDMGGFGMFGGGDGGLGFSGMGQPAPQPAPDMGGFGGFGGGMDFSGLGGFDAGAMAPQPAPSYDMSAFGGFGGMPQQPAPSFDMGGMGGGMDFGGGMDYSGMDFGSVGGFAGGGPIQYAAGGKFLRGPGDGMSDDIKANINGEQEARLADGEFVIPADVVSHIGNGSSEAGADRLYKMMADIRKARTGKTRQAPEINVKKYLPA